MDRDHTREGPADDPLACPNCHRSDKVEKVSHVFSAGHSTGRYGGPTQSVISSHGDGLGYAVGSVDMAGSSSTDLVQQLTLPPEPSYASPQQRGWLYIVLAVELIPLITIEAVIISKDQACLAPKTLNPCATTGDAMMSDTVFFVTMAIMVLTLLLLIRRMGRVRRQNYALHYSRWVQAKDTWNALYYCSRDGGVFLPNGGSPLIPADQTIEWLFPDAPPQAHLKRT
jgi:hypothetical protein